MAVTVAVTGATGFIGSACVEALARAGFSVRPVPAPRLRTDARSLDALDSAVDPSQVRELAARYLSGVDVLVNAAGQASATSTDLPSLLGANAVLPSLLARAATEAGVGRMVHISSAAVQGRRVLDESESLQPQSPYALSKALAECLLRKEAGTPIIRYRPTSVQGPQRGVTRSLVRLAESPVASVAAPGDDRSPQTSAEQVATAVATLANPAHEPPSIVLHPWEGVTTGQVLAELGGKDPRLVGRRTASASVKAAYAASRFSGRMAGQARRLDMVLFGQEQHGGWLDERMGVLDAGWLARIRLDVTRPQRS